MATEKENGTGITIVKLSRPQQLNGSIVETIELNLGPMRGKDLRNIIGQFNTLYKEYVPVPTVDIRFQAMVAAYAAKINPADLEELDAPDYMKLCATVRDFLVG
jgi:tail assembly chaperone E/41/14-like protein